MKKINSNQTQKIDIIPDQQSGEKIEKMPQENPNIQVHQKGAIYIIPISNLRNSINNNTIIQKKSRKDEITTTVYKCKLQYLSAYNYTYAVYLTNILNLNFDWAQVQILPIPSKEPKQKQNQIDQFHIIYRFDIYDPLDEIKDQNFKDIKLQQNSYKNPMRFILKNHFQYLSIDQNLESFLSQKNNLNFELQKIKSSQSQQKYQSKIRQNQQKFQFFVPQKDYQGQKVIHVFQTNLIFDLFLKPYHMYHDFKQCGQKFLTAMSETFTKYPYAVLNS